MNERHDFKVPLDNEDIDLELFSFHGVVLAHEVTKIRINIKRVFFIVKKNDHKNFQ